MPFRVVNRRSRRGPQQQNSSSSTHDKDFLANPTAQVQDFTSIYSDASSENGTACSDLSIFKESPPHYPGANIFSFDMKRAEKQRVSEEYDPYSIENVLSGPLHHPSPAIQPPLGTVHQLANALGPDNVPQTTEIDTIPCAGVRIPQGQLRGLLAWRLVVTIPGSANRKGNWWEDETKFISLSKRQRRGQSMRILPRPPNKPVHSYSYSDTMHLQNNPFQSFANRSHPHLESFFALPPEQKKPTSLVSNFILDTSLPYSLISRDTLLALGYPFTEFPKDAATDSSEEPTVTLSIQGVSTRLRIANFGEASRLGVQFLHDAGVSVFFPRNGVGVGPVLYLESARILNDVPSTLPDIKENKPTLQQRIRILFGLAP